MAIGRVSGTVALEENGGLTNIYKLEAERADDKAGNTLNSQSRPPLTYFLQQGYIS